MPQCPPAAFVFQLAGVEVTLSFREKLPTPEGLRKHEIVSRLWDGKLLFATPQITEFAQRY